MPYGLSIYKASTTNLDTSINANYTYNSSAIDAARAADTGSTSRARVLSAFTDYNYAPLYPAETAIRYWMVAGLGANNNTFKTSIDSVNANNPNVLQAIKDERATEDIILAPLARNATDGQDGVLCRSVFDANGANQTALLLNIATANNYVDNGVYSLPVNSYGSLYNTGWDGSKYLGSKYFNGTDSYAVVSGGSTPAFNLSGSEFTIEAWIYPEEYGDGQWSYYTERALGPGIIGTAYSNTDSKFAWQLSLGSNKYGLAFWTSINNGTPVKLVGAGTNMLLSETLSGGVSNYIKTPGVRLNTWSHVAVTGNLSTGTFDMWIDGIKVGTSTGWTGGALTLQAPNSNQCIIGTAFIGHDNDNTVYYRYFKGRIASPRIVRSKQVYYTNFTPSTRKPPTRRSEVLYGYARNFKAMPTPDEASIQYWMTNGIVANAAVKQFSTTDITWNQVKVLYKNKDAGTETFTFNSIKGKEVIATQVLVNTPDISQTYYAWDIVSNNTTGAVTISGGNVDAIITILMR